MFFKKKIIVTEEMKQTLQSFDEIPWASCCFLDNAFYSCDGHEKGFKTYKRYGDKCP